MREQILQDIRYAFRSLKNAPLFTTVALLSLAIGIGANTAMFSVIDAVLLRPMPFPKPEQLVVLKSDNPKRGLSFTILSPAEIQDYRAETSIFAAVSAYRSSSGFLTSPDGASQRVNAIAVDTGFLTVLQRAPMIGRGFTPEDRNAVILQHAFWKQHFGSDAQILGRTIVLSDTPRTIVGVMPEDFQGPGTGEVDLLTPLVVSPAQMERGTRFINAIARLQPGATIERAQDRMTSVSNGLAEQYPDDHAGWTIRLVELQESVVGDSRLPLMVLFGAVFAVLCIASTNVASLMSARGSSRRTEIAIRTALGASRSRVVRQIMAESSLLSSIGGAAGLVLAKAALDVFLALVPAGLPRIASAGIDARVLAFNFGLMVITSLLFGWLPAREAARTDPNRWLGTGRAGGEGTRGKARSVLVVVEVAVTLILVTGAALLLNSFVRLQLVDTGLNGENVVTFSVSGPPSSGARKAEFLQTLLSRSPSIPGVRSASLSGAVPMRGFKMIAPVRIEGNPDYSEQSEDMAAYNYVTTDYFKVFGIPLRQGRAFSRATDHATGPRVMIVNESLARRFFNGNPVGQRVLVPGRDAMAAEIVGVVRDVHQISPGDPVKLEMYVPLEQQSDVPAAVAVRVDGDPSLVIANLAGLVRSIDDKVVIEQMTTVNQLLWNSVAEERFRTLLVSTYSALAILLSVIGIYSVVAYSVGRRRHEIGIRMALGGKDQVILRMLVWQGFTPCLVGIGLGFMGSLAAARSIQSLLFKVSPMDPLTLAAAVAIVTFAGLCACAIPAWRALSVDPMITLKQQ